MSKGFIIIFKHLETCLFFPSALTVDKSGWCRFNLITETKHSHKAALQTYRGILILNEKPSEEQHEEEMQKGTRLNRIQ